jgi:hypothetical protein
MKTILTLCFVLLLCALSPSTYSFAQGRTRPPGAAKGALALSITLNLDSDDGLS